MNDIDGIVIIGGGQAAGWAARTLREQGYAKRLSVVSDEAHDFYERPPLSKDVLSGHRQPAQLALFPPEAVAALDIDWHRPHRATAIDRDARRVHLDNGEQLPFDRPLIATGSRPRLPDPAWAQIDGVMTLRNVEDALALRERLLTTRRLAVVGGGWIGLEVAALARALNVEVAVYERGPSLCGRSVGADAAAHLAALQRSRDVTLHLACGELSLSAAASGVAVTTADAEAVFDTVLVGAGAQLNVELAQSAGLRVEQGIVVDGSGRTSDPSIYAAGDVAQHPVYGLCVQSWANAQNQGMASARGLLGLDADYDDVPWLWSDQHDVNIQILGLHSEDNHHVHRAADNGSNIFFQLDPQSRLRQMVAFGDGRAIKLGRRWMASGRALDARELADPAFDLMSLR
jgi:3-phenylpropionate/trans-cinnamate dioxygenase ferredoxin reductase subunit